MIHNTGDIRTYSLPPPAGIPPVSHNRKWRRVFSVNVVGDACSSMCRPTKFGQKSLMTTAYKNSRYNTKRRREMLLKPNV